jgi:hypothetical protein
MKIFKTKKYTILSSILKYSFVVVFAIMLFTPSVFALTTGPTGGGGTGTEIKTKILNPLGNNITDIPSFIKAIIDIVVMIGVPIVTLAIIYSGFLFVKAQGNPEQLTKAKSTLLYTLIGAALLLGAFVIASAIGSTVTDITSTT